MNADRKTSKIGLRLGRCFLTPKALDIALHMSPEEEDLLRQHNKSAISEASLALPILAFCAFIILQIFLGWPGWLVPVFYVAVMVVYFLITRSSRRKFFDRHREMLCQTEYARAHGITPENLRVYRFPWSRR